MNAIRLSTQPSSSEPHSSEPDLTDRRRLERSAVRWIIVALSVVLVAVVVSTPWRGSNPVEHDVVSAVRDRYVELSEAAAPDDRVIEAARSFCAPSGPSAAQRAWLASVQIDPAELAQLAEPLCPSR